MTERTPFSVYSTWGLHDELGDTVELSEAMVRGALDNLDRLHNRAGLTFDYFHLDAFWFDPVLGYRSFKKPHWPNGFEAVAEEIHRRGMAPGLWYSTTGAMLNVDAWSQSRTADARSYSLMDGPYAEILLGDLLYAAEQWGVRFFKFDFTNFNARAAGIKAEAAETYAGNVQAFIGICRRLKQSYPDSKIITHTGFWRGAGNGPLSLNEPFGWETSLFEVVDLAFSGDPHPTDIPQSALVRNLDLFQDHHVWKMHREGIPLRRIEDHGALIATTNTAGYRGRTGFRRTHIGQLARGARRDMFYGDLGVLTDDDAAGMVKARELFFDAFSRNLETSILAEKGPGFDPWHGYLTGGGMRGLLYLVNTTLLVQRAVIKRPNIASARTLFYTGTAVPPLQTQPDELTVELQPEQLAVIGLGVYADAQYDLGSENDPPLVGTGRLLAGTFREQGSGLVGELESIGEDEILEVTVRVLDARPTHYPGGNEYRFAVPAEDASVRPPRALLPITIAVEGEAGSVEAFVTIPDVTVWAGMSWTTQRFRVTGPVRVTVSQTLDPPRRLRCMARALKEYPEGE
jgi:hypothetical protein